MHFPSLLAGLTVPPKFDMSENSLDGLGTIGSLDEFGIEALVQEVNVKRKEKLSSEVKSWRTKINFTE